MPNKSIFIQQGNLAFYESLPNKGGFINAHLAAVKHQLRTDWHAVSENLEAGQHMIDVLTGDTPAPSGVSQHVNRLKSAYIRLGYKVLIQAATKLEA